MRKIFLVLAYTCYSQILVSQPIALHPDNPHYFIYKGEPVLLITSAEHYGAVLNLDFDYKKYLKTLKDEGMNYTRIFAGSYVSIPGAFGIQYNNLSPKVTRFITPWKQTDEPGLFKGEAKYDLSKWNPDFFSRLKDFVAIAEANDIIVEITLFCGTYQDEFWVRHPFNYMNNVNGLEEFDRKAAYTLNNGKLLEFQQKMVQKIVAELNHFDNIFYEIQNEPWFDDPQRVLPITWTRDPDKLGSAGWTRTASKASLIWQETIAETIVREEKELPNKHLIAQNFCCFKYSLEEIDPDVSILNFHYAWPDAAWMNYGWNLPIGFDESGTAGSSDTTYLRQAWSFILAGGAIFNNLDYSFTVGHEDGTAINNAPGNGSQAFRKMIKLMHDFVASFDFISMSPDHNVVYHAPGLVTQALSEKGEQYAIYLWGKPSSWLKLDLPKGDYDYELFSPYNGKSLKNGFVTHQGGIFKMGIPGFHEMAVLKILKRK